MTWDELFERFTASGRLAPNTIFGYSKHLKAFLHFWSDQGLSGPAIWNLRIWRGSNCIKSAQLARTGPVGRPAQ